MEGDSVRKGIEASDITMSSLPFTGSSEPVSFVMTLCVYRVKQIMLDILPRVLMMDQTSLVNPRAIRIARFNFHEKWGILYFPSRCGF